MVLALNYPIREVINMVAVDDQLNEQCPRCANDTVYVEKIEALPASLSPSYLCRCGKCGWRFRVYLPDLVFAEDAPPTAS
jgi:DNA-directed RNA polymerase subunit M/transcription elongation factor TFIIS